MEWEDLSDVSGNILERCWGLRTDNPRSFSVKFGQLLYKEPVKVEHYHEILEYQKTNPHFNVQLLEDGIFVEGNCQFGSWDE